MGTSAKLDNAPTPAYVSFSTYLTFLDSLKQTAVPPRIDNSVMSKFAGSVKTQLRTALRFTKAIDDFGTVQPGFKELVAARGTDGWKQIFSDRFFEWYGPVVGDLDIDSATLQQLKERFKQAGVEGSVLIKATRFYLSALEETGSTYSPHFKVRQLSTGVTPAKPKKQKKTETGPGQEDRSPPAEEPLPKGLQKLSLPLRGRLATLVVPDDLKEMEWEMVDSYLRSYFAFGKKAAK